MKKAILLLVSGMLILSLSGMAMGSSTVLVPDDTINVAPGQTGTVKVTIQQLIDGEEYKIQVAVLQGPGIKASLQGNTVLDMPADPTDLSTWADLSYSLEKTFTYNGVENADLKIYREPGAMETGTVRITVLKDFQVVGETTISSESINVTVPEFPTVALPVAAILGLVFVFGRKKEGL